MADLERLARKHAYWSDLRERFRKEGLEELNICDNYELDRIGGFSVPRGKNCIEQIYDSWKGEESDHYHEYCELPPFEEVWDQSVEAGVVCVHCQKVRELKKKRAEAGRRLGIIRGALTRIGRRLASE